MKQSTTFSHRGINYLMPFLLVSSLFFLWGFAHGILETLNPHFQDLFEISKAKAAFVQAAVYTAYFLMALPAGFIIKRWGYRRGVVTGLLLYAIGAFMFFPGSRLCSFPFFVFSLFVIGCGLTCLETSANPYVTVLGAPDKAATRINLSQSLNGVGWIVGPLVGSLLFPDSENGADNGIDIAIPYVIVGVLVLMVMLVFCRVPLPEIKEEAETDDGAARGNLWNGAFIFGMVSLFLYCAAQTGVNSFFINYAVENADIAKNTASLLLAFGGMGLFVLGRVAGSGLMSRIQPGKLLAFNAIVATLATLVVVTTGGMTSMVGFGLIFLSESIMFPTIFAIALSHSRGNTKLASSMLIMMIVGGAVIPVIMGLIADITGSMSPAFLVPMACYVVILAFGLKNKRGATA